MAATSDAGGGAAAPQPAGPSAPAGAKHDRGKASAAMPLSEFMDKGVGGAQMPRKQQERKDKEKQKRERLGVDGGGLKGGEEGASAGACGL